MTLVLITKYIQNNMQKYIQNDIENDMQGAQTQKSKYNQRAKPRAI